MLLREIDVRIGFTAAPAARIEDPRNQVWITHAMAELVRARLQVQRCAAARGVRRVLDPHAIHSERHPVP